MIHVHCKDGQSDRTSCCTVKFCAHQSKAEAPLRQTECPLDRHAVYIICIFEFFINGRIFLWSTEGMARKMYAVVLTVSKVIPVPVDLVGKDSLRIMPDTFFVPLCCCSQHIAFVVGIKGDLLNPGKPFSSRLRSSLAPNSTGVAAFPLTIGRIYGWLILTILSGTVCMLLSYMYFCCSWILSRTVSFPACFSVISLPDPRY